MAYLDVRPPEDVIGDKQWHKHINAADPHAVYTLSTALFEDARAREEAEGQSPAIHTLRLIAAATSMCLSEGSRPPFHPLLRFKGKRSPALEDFGAIDAEVLAAIAETVEEPGVRARLADVAATVGHETGGNQWRSGVLASHAYLELAEQHLLSADGVQVLGEFVRGLRLAWVYDRKNEGVGDRYWALLRKAITRSLADGHCAVAVALAREIRKSRYDMAGEVALELQEAAESYSAGGDYDRAATCLCHAAELWQRAHDRRRAKECRLGHGEALVARASGGRGSAIVLAAWLSEGIEVLRRAGADRSRVDDLRRELAHVQRHSLSEFRQFEQRTDVTEIVQAISHHIVGPSLMDSLIQMVLGPFHWPKFDDVRQNVIDAGQKYPLSSMFSSDLLNDDGQVIARQKAFDETDEEAIYQAMIRQCVEFETKLRADVLVKHAVDLIFTKHHPSLLQLVEIVAASPMVPPRREESLARGLLAGFNWDWLECATYLIPQVEPFVRYHFHRNDVITLVTREDGTQTEKSLTELLRSYDAERIFGKDLIMELETLLVHPVGYLLRHNWAHGLLDDQGLASRGVLALWWTMWRLILWPWMVDHGESVIVEQPSS